MSNEQDLIQLINGILDASNQQRKQNEETLANFRDNSPDNFITLMLQLCQIQDPDLRIRQFASVHLRNCTSTFAPKSFKNVFPLLQPQTQELLKNTLFQLLENETSQNVRNHICDAIGEIGGSLYTDETKNDWPQLLSMLWQLFLSPKPELNEAGFKIMGTLFTYAIDLFTKHINDIGALFQKGLINPNERISTATIQALANFITSSEPKLYKPFEPLLGQMMQTTYEVLKKNEELGEDCMEVFSDIVDAEPKFIRKNFQTFYQGVFTIYSDAKIDQGVKRIGTEALLILAERSPKLFKTDQNYISQLVEMIFFHMIQISPEVQEEWMKPKEGFNDDIEQDDDCETTRFGMSSIDRLIESIGEKEMLPILSALVQKLLQHQDWRYKYAAIMALSQVGEYIDEVKEVEPIVQLVMSMLNDANPMIRYAVCHAIGQIADDMKPKFQENFISIVLPQLIARVKIDDVPRVTSHLLAALTNFVEGAESGVAPFTQELVQLSVGFFQNTISLVKENAMSVIAATAEACKLDFVPYFNEIMPILFTMLETHTNREYRQLKGQTIEAITLIAAAVKKEVFLPYLDQTIKVLITIQSGQFETVDPQKSYVLSGWQRLCLTCPEQLSNYLPQIIPSLFELVKKVFDLHSSTGTNEIKESEEFHTYDNEEAEIAIHMLSVFIEELKDKFFPYFDTCTQLIVPLCKFTTDETIRRASAKCLVSLIENVKATGNQVPLIQGAKYFIGVILEAAQKEFDPEVIIDQVDCLKDIIDIVKDPFMNASEVNELSDKVFKLLLESDQRKAENEKLQKEEDVDEDEVSMIKEENETEENLHVKIAEFIGVLFKTHKDQVQTLLELIINTILPKVLDKNLSSKMHQFGIFLIDDMIEHLGFQVAGVKFAEFANVLAAFALDKVCFVRQAAVYGIGVQAEKTPKENFNLYGQLLVKAIADSFSISKNENDTDKAFGHCRDNSIAALGKLIKYQEQIFGAQLDEALQRWLFLLPMNFDKPEAKIQHDMLADLIIFNGNKLLNGKQENALQVLRIFADVVKTKKSTDETDKKIRNALQVFEQLDIVKGNWQAVFGLLSQEHQTKLLQLAQQQG